MGLVLVESCIPRHCIVVSIGCGFNRKAPSMEHPGASVTFAGAPAANITSMVSTAYNQSVTILVNIAREPGLPRSIQTIPS